MPTDPPRPTLQVSPPSLDEVRSEPAGVLFFGQGWDGEGGEFAGEVGLEGEEV
jgi:hypothetical protein